MAFEKMIKNAFDESRNNCRFGDTLEEIKETQDYIKNAEKIGTEKAIKEHSTIGVVVTTDGSIVDVERSQ